VGVRLVLPRSLPKDRQQFDALKRYVRQLGGKLALIVVHHVHFLERHILQFECKVQLRRKLVDRLEVA
jgi:hypothetical protein